MADKEFTEIAEWEAFNLADNLKNVVDAMAEVGYLVHNIKHGNLMNDDELLAAQATITEPLILYRQLLEQITQCRT